MTKKGRSIPCEIDGIEFGSYRAAARYFDVHFRTIANWIRTGRGRRLERASEELGEILQLFQMWLPTTMKTQLSHEAKKRGLTMSSLVRLLVSQFLEVAQKDEAFFMLVVLTDKDRIEHRVVRDPANEAWD